MRLERKQELELILELLTISKTKVYSVEYNVGKQALITFAYGLSLDLTNPDERAFYDAFKQIKRDKV